MKHQQEEFARHVRGLVAASVKLSELWSKRPKGATWPESGQFSNAIKSYRKTQTILNRLDK